MQNNADYKWSREITCSAAFITAPMCVCVERTFAPTKFVNVNIDITYTGPLRQWVDWAIIGQEIAYQIEIVTIVVYGTASVFLVALWWIC